MDNLSNRFAANENASSALASKITQLAGTYLSLEGAKKFMGISDTYTNTLSKLSLITNNLTEQKALQQEIFAAADRARGSYSTMADTVAKLGITSGQQFGNTDNIVKFTETMQKMFKIGGTPVANQSGAMLQLQQAIGLGKLQGQDLRILAEDAPLVEKAIATYMHKSVGEVKALGTEGQITSQVLINSILNYSGVVDKQMGKMKYTWGDYWNLIKNGATKAFGGVFNDESKILGSANFKNTINGIIASFSVLANVAGAVLGTIANVGGFIASNWSIIAPIIGGVVAALIIYNGVAAATAIINGIVAFSANVHAAAAAMQAGATFATTAAQWGLNAALYACPLTWVILLIVALIAAFYVAIAAINHFAGTSISATGLIVGGFEMGIAIIENLFITFYNVAIAVMVGIFNVGVDVAELFGNGFKNPLGSAIKLFASFGHAAMQVLEAVSGAFDTIFHTQTTNTLKAFDASVGALANKTAGANAVKLPRMDASKLQMKYVNPISAWKTGYKTGANFDTGISSILNRLNTANSAKNSIKNPGLGNSGKLGKLGTSAKPATVKGTGSGGTVTVNIADQDLQYLRDLAEKQYVNKFSTAVLSPKMTFQYTGTPGTQTDMKKIYADMSKMFDEELASAANGSYDI